MGKSILISILALTLMSPLLTGCSRELFGGAAVGAAGAGAAYEYSNKRQMDRLEDDYKAGRINQEEYERRKEEISRGSLIY